MPFSSKESNTCITIQIFQAQHFRKYDATIMILSFWTDKAGQTV